MVTYKARARSPHDAREICHLWSLAPPRKLELGYLGFRCGINTRDPRDILLYEEWFSSTARAETLRR
jgi:hypothetical protein